jgi:hypothetical protein
MKSNTKSDLKEKDWKYINGLYGLYDYDHLSNPFAAGKSLTDGESYKF